MFSSPEHKPTSAIEVFTSLIEQKSITLPVGQSIADTIEQIKANQQFTNKLLSSGGIITSLGDFDFESVISPYQVLINAADAGKTPIIKTFYGYENVSADIVSPSTPTRNTEITVVSPGAHRHLTYTNPERESFWFVATKEEPCISMFGGKFTRNLEATLIKKSLANNIRIPGNSQITQAILAGIAFYDGYGYTPLSLLRKNFAFAESQFKD